MSTNAGGVRLLRYGSLHGNILGIEAVSKCLVVREPHPRGRAASSVCILGLVMLCGSAK